MAAAANAGTGLRDKPRQARWDGNVRPARTFLKDPLVPTRVSSCSQPFDSEVHSLSQLGKRHVPKLRAPRVPEVFSSGDKDIGRATTQRESGAKPRRCLRRARGRSRCVWPASNRQFWTKGGDKFFFRRRSASPWIGGSASRRRLSVAELFGRSPCEQLEHSCSPGPGRVIQARQSGTGAAGAGQVRGVQGAHRAEKARARLSVLDASDSSGRLRDWDAAQRSQLLNGGAACAAAPPT